MLNVDIVGMIDCLLACGADHHHWVRRSSVLHC